MTSHSRDDPQDGWVVSAIGRVATVNPPRPDLSQVGPSATVGFIPMTAVDADSGQIVNVESRKLSAVGKKSYRTFAPGDVLFAKITPCMENGKAAVVPELPNNLGFGSTEFHVLRPSQAVVPNYLWRFIRQTEYRKEAEAHMTGSVGQLRVPVDFIKKTNFPLAPIAEQYRIAERLDEIEDQRASINGHLQTARNGLARLHRAVLSAACTGRLTEDWREQHPHAGENLLPFAEARRRAHDKSFVEPQRNAHARWNDLPKGWTLAPLGLLLKDLKYGTSKRSAYGQDGTPVLRIPNVSTGVLNVKDLKFAALTDREIDALKLCVGDLLMVRSNGSVQLVGLTAPVTSVGKNMAFAGYLMRLRVDQELMKSEFLHLVLASSQLRHQIELPARSTSGVHNINTQEVRGLVVPVPGVDEQAEIVRRASTALDAAGRIATYLKQAAHTLDRVSASALTKAFRGELVPTEAALAAEEGRNYETAEELLARVNTKTRQ